VRRTSFEDMNCSIAKALEVIGDRWTLLIIRDGLVGITRFDEIRSRLGIARNVLASRLDHLVDHGVITRIAYQDHPCATTIP
jgi:DNA-binding HxlR family transcriptional regulator